MAYSNEDKEHKPRFKKCGIEWDWGVGILTINPGHIHDSKLNECEFKCRPHIKWLWYDNYWYLLKEDIDFDTYFDDVYSNEQMLEKLINLIA